MLAAVAVLYYLWRAAHIAVVRVKPGLDREDSESCLMLWWVPVTFCLRETMRLVDPSIYAQSTIQSTVPWHRLGTLAAQTGPRPGPLNLRWELA